MIRILILIMAGAIVLALSYFLMKKIPLLQKMLVVGGGLLAAMAAILLQDNNPIYMPFLAIVGVALIASLLYTKIMESKKNARMKESEERRTRRTIEKSQDNSSKTAMADAFSMQSVEISKEERKIG